MKTILYILQLIIVTFVNCKHEGSILFRTKDLIVQKEDNCGCNCQLLPFCIKYKDY